MIHMLSRFDLKSEVDPDGFQASYETFVQQMQAHGLVQSTGKIGRRETDTPMDTDEDDAPAYYVVMSFKDRNQLDKAYAHIMDPEARNGTAHSAIHQSVIKFVFTCWRDLEDQGDRSAGA